MSHTHHLVVGQDLSGWTIENGYFSAIREIATYCLLARENDKPFICLKEADLQRALEIYPSPNKDLKLTTVKILLLVNRREMTAVVIKDSTIYKVEVLGWNEHELIPRNLRWIKGESEF